MEISLDIEYRNTKLKEVRETAGLSQGQLAEATGISMRVLQNYEQGVRNLNGAKLVTLLKICKALQCKLHDIISDPQAIELHKEVYSDDVQR